MKLKERLTKRGNKLQQMMMQHERQVPTCAVKGEDIEKEEEDAAKVEMEVDIGQRLRLQIGDFVRVGKSCGCRHGFTRDNRFAREIHNFLHVFANGYNARYIKSTKDFVTSRLIMPTLVCGAIAIRLSRLYHTVYL